MVTIKDAVKGYDHSVCTIPHALSGERYLEEGTEQKILETVAELRYHPNALVVGLETRYCQALVLVLPSLTNVYYTKLERYLESYTSGKGYIIYLNNTEYSLEEERQILENLIGMDVAGVIIAPITSRHDHIMNLAKYDIPYVYSSRSFEDDMGYCPRLDNEKAAYEAVSYMVKLEHKDIDGIFQSFDNLTYRERYDGMAQAPRGHGLGCRLDHMLFDVNPEDMGTTLGRILQLLQKAGRPETIFACNDMAAFDIYRACHILGLQTPDHLSVFGYDDCIVADYVTLPLSTVSVPVRRLAGTAIDFIHGYLESGVRAEPPILKAPLIIRNSVRDLNLD